MPLRYGSHIYQGINGALLWHKLANNVNKMTLTTIKWQEIADYEYYIKSYT